MILTRRGEAGGHFALFKSRFWAGCATRLFRISWPPTRSWPGQTFITALERLVCGRRARGGPPEQRSEMRPPMASRLSGPGFEPLEAGRRCRSITRNRLAVARANFFLGRRVARGGQERLFRVGDPGAAGSARRGRLDGGFERRMIRLQCVLSLEVCCGRSGWGATSRPNLEDMPCSVLQCWLRWSCQ